MSKRDGNWELTSLLMTNAPMKTSTIDPMKTIVATTRTGLNIYAYGQRVPSLCHLLTMAHTNLSCFANCTTS